MKKIFPTKSYFFLSITISLINILLCLFMPLTVCSFPLTIQYTESFNFTYMHRAETQDYDYIINTKEFGTTIDDIYCSATQSGNYIIINGKHIPSNLMTTTNTVHEMDLFLEIRCASLLDFLLKRDSSFYVSTKINTFPNITNNNLHEEDTYILSGNDWILYTSSPVELINATPGPLYLHETSIYYIGYLSFITIIMIVLLIFMQHKNSIIICKDKKNNINPVLSKLLLDIRTFLPAKNIATGNSQFVRYMSWRYNVWIFAYLGLYESFISLLGSTGKIRIHFFLIGIVLSYAHHIVYTAAYTAYKKGNSITDELCRLTSFIESEYKTLAQWNNFNIFIRICDLLYIDNKIEAAEILLENSWRIFRPDDPQMQLSYYLLLCKLEASNGHLSNIKNNLEKAKQIFDQNGQQLKLNKRIPSLLLNHYDLIESAFLGKWDEYSTVSKKIEKITSDPADLATIKNLYNTLHS